LVRRLERERREREARAKTFREQELLLEREIDAKIKEGRDDDDNYMLKEQQRRK